MTSHKEAVARWHLLFADKEPDNVDAINALRRMTWQRSTALPEHVTEAEAFEGLWQDVSGIAWFSMLVVLQADHKDQFTICSVSTLRGLFPISEEPTRRALEIARASSGT